MRLDRRAFIGLAATGMTSRVLGSVSALDVRHVRIRAIAFDAFPVFDPRPVSALAEQLFPDRGIELNDAWRTRQFEYQWLRALSGQYADFLQATRDALIYATNVLKLNVEEADRDRLLAAYFNLPTWPEAADALHTLRMAGLRLALLSNWTPDMLAAAVRNNGLDLVFDAVISTDRQRTFKPDPRAYRLVLDTLGLRRDEILFVAHAGWDVAGAKWFGLPTYWVNRLALPAEQLGVAADGMGRNLNDLVSWV